MNRSSMFFGVGILVMLGAVAFAQDPGPAPGNEKGDLPPGSVKSVIVENSLRANLPTADVDQKINVSWEYANAAFTKAQVRRLVDGKVVESIDITGTQAEIDFNAPEFGSLAADATKGVQVTVVPYGAGDQLREDEAKSINLTIRAPNQEPRLDAPPALSSAEVIGGQSPTVTLRVSDPNRDPVECWAELQTGTDASGWQSASEVVTVNGSGEAVLTIQSSGAVSAQIEKQYRICLHDARVSQPVVGAEFRVTFLPEGSGPTAQGPGAPSTGGPASSGPAVGGPEAERPDSGVAAVGSNQAPEFTAIPLMLPRSPAVTGGSTVVIRWDARDRENDEVQLLVRLRAKDGDPAAAPVVSISSTDRRCEIRTPYVLEQREYTLEVALSDGKAQTEFQAAPLTLRPMTGPVLADEVRFRETIAVERPTRGRAVTQANGLRDPQARRRPVQYELAMDEHGNMVARERK